MSTRWMGNNQMVFAQAKLTTGCLEIIAFLGRHFGRVFCPSG
jgi:hypothetical protein